MIANTAALRTERHDNIAVLSLAHPPINSLNAQLRNLLLQAIYQANDDPGVIAIVVNGDGRMFSAGADIREFDQGTLFQPDPNDINLALERSNKPVVAAIHDCALGGGLELAMSCHARIATKDAKMGLPEIKLGLIPGAGGTQRLPRLVGISAALPALMTGNTWLAPEALQLGLLDQIAQSQDTLLQEALALARRLATGKLKKCAASQLTVPDDETAFVIAHKLAKDRLRGQPAAQRIIECVRKSTASEPFSDGIAFERQAFMELIQSPESLALRHIFFAERSAARPIGPATPLPIRTVGIIGSGTMGSGIALSFIAGGYQVKLVDISKKALERGRASIEQTLESLVRKGRLTEGQKDAQAALLTTTHDLRDIDDSDLIIEAVIEDLELKQNVLAELGRHCKPEATVATNTSTLDIDALAQAFGRPSSFLGLHFFSPANVMKLLEIVRGAQTSPQIIRTALELAKTIGKTAVVSGVCYGFIGNRMLESYLRETDRLLLEGCTPAQVDNALEQFGMAMGPCRMMDLAGVDVNANVLQQRMLGGFSPSDPAYRSVCLELNARGRHGQKSGQGYYRYDGRTQQQNTETESIIEHLAAKHQIKRRKNISNQEIVDRCLYPLINEGYAILEEGIAAQSGDIDVVWTAGYGFPRYRGGPMYYATLLGPGHVRECMQYYAERYPDFPEDWKIADSLKRPGRRNGMQA